MTQVKRNELVAHNTPGQPRCANSRRTLINDLGEADWSSAFARITQHVERSRNSWPQFYKPIPPTGSPLTHLARSRTAHPLARPGTHPKRSPNSTARRRSALPAESQLPPPPARPNLELGRAGAFLRAPLEALMHLPVPRPDPAIAADLLAADHFTTLARHLAGQGGTTLVYAPSITTITHTSPTAPMARIAGLLHLAEHLTDSFDRPISFETMAGAQALIDYYTDHALAVFDLMSTDPATARAHALWDWIERTGTVRFTARDAFTALTRTKFPKMADLEPALAVLEQHGHLRRLPGPPTTGRGRPPTPTYETNPRVMS